MRASIISVGSEILRGTLLDTNAQHFAQELQTIGLEVVRVTQVQDDVEAISSVLRSACDFSTVVVMTGGLGPTDDDQTREAILSLTGETPTINDAIVAQIRERFELRGEKMPERNEKQAWEIPSAVILPNHHGTAPGWLVSHADTSIVALPGPPRENRPMWREIVRPLLVPRLDGQAIITRTVKTIGIGESAVADRLSHLTAVPWPDVATFAKSDGVHVTITASHADRATADAAVRAASEEVVARLADHAYGFGDDSLAAAITQPLAAAGARMVVWEIGTAGAFANLLLADSAAQRVVTETRAWPAHAHAVDGARELAREAVRTTNTGVATAIVANIDELDSGVSDGRVDIAFAHAGSIVERCHVVRGTPAEIRRRATLLASELLWYEVRSAAGVPMADASPSHSSTT